VQKKKVFISSVQSEFSTERQVLFDYLTTDALLGKFFEPFVFENVPAITATPVVVFLQEVERCDIYIGIFGQKYGYEDSEGISPTEREYDYATHLYKARFVFLKNVSEERHPKEKALIQKAEQSVVRKNFDTPEQLKTAVYASLVRYLEDNEFIRTTPFDATLNNEATFTDLDEEKIRTFAQIAHRKRSFPFDKDSDVRTVLTHLNLIKDERITNSALLLFAHHPQRFFITSEIKCAHFHGLIVSKPIPSYQVYKGDVFEMIAAAVDFVLSKINLYVGERNISEVVDVEYELPIQAVTEAIVNAVAHRDYTSNASVQVMLFADKQSRFIATRTYR
jgi:ATP-dependent DNA helicase RecG